MQLLDSCMNCVPYFQFVGGQHFLFDLLEPSLTYRGFCHHPHGILQMINFNFTKHHSYTLNNTRIIIYPHYNFLYVQCLIIYNGFLQYLYWYNVWLRISTVINFLFWPKYLIIYKKFSILQNQHLFQSQSELP